MVDVRSSPSGPKITIPTGGGSAIAYVNLGEDGNDNPFSNNGNDNQYRPLTALNTDFDLFASGAWSMGANGVLTYTGPDVVAYIAASITFEVPNGGGNGTYGFGIAHNDDLIGEPVFGDEQRKAGANLVFTEEFLSTQELNVTSFRRVALTSGDTLRPVVGASFLGGQADTLIEGFGMQIIYQ